jgi:hypothetical protein
MKMYKFVESDVVTVDGQPLPPKRLSRQPSTYVSPDRLALSILFDCVGDDAAMLLSHEFQTEILDHCQPGEEITSDGIEEWVNFKCQIGASIQAAIWSKHGEELPITAGPPLRMPRLLRVQKVPTT